MFNGNYYNPYMFQGVQNVGKLANTGVGFRNIFKGFNFNNFLTSTGKTLNVINQAIPIFYQVRPIINNARTMFKVAGAIRNSDNRSSINNSSRNNVVTNRVINSNQNINQTDSTSHLENNNDFQGNPAFFL